MDAKIREMIDNRQKANVEILQMIGDAVMKYPDLRFGQILAALEIIQYKNVNVVGIFGADQLQVIDPFNEESVEMLNRMKNKIAESDI